MQFGEGGAGTFSDGKLYSQIKDPQHLRPQGADRVRQGRRAGGDPLRQQAAHRHLPAGDDGREACARRSRRWAARSASSQRVDDLLIERRPAAPRARRDARRRRAAARRPRGAGARPQRARHLRRCCTTRGVFIEAKPFSIGFRIEHPQSLIDRARFGPQAGHPLLGAADYKLVHHCRNGRSVYSFCMCPGGTVVAAASRAGPRGHQRHEPVLAQRAQRQRRHRRRHHAGGLSRATSARRHRASSAHWEARAFELGGGDYDAPGQLVGDFLARPAVDARSARCCRRTSRACAWAISRRALPDYAIDGDPRGAAGLRPADQGLRDARRGADRRRDAHLVAAAHQPRSTTARASTRAACTRPAKARAMRAASCRPASMASASPRRSRRDLAGATAVATADA